MPGLEVCIAALFSAPSPGSLKRERLGICHFRFALSSYMRIRLATKGRKVKRNTGGCVKRLIPIPY